MFYHFGERKRYVLATLLAVFTLAIVGCQSQTAVTDDVETAVVPPTATIPPPTVPIAPAPTATEIPDADQLGSTNMRSIDGMTQVYVPAGSFMMGSPDSIEEADPNEMPQHEVELDAFWIDQTEVSVAQFALFIEDTSYETTAEIKGSGFIYDGSWRLGSGAMWEHPTGEGSTAVSNHPVTQVSWDDAVAYCEWADSSLPTEAQWEYAAAGSEGSIYPWGDVFDSAKLNYCDSNCDQEWKDDTADDGHGLTSPVGRFPDGRSWVGALDMAGNVWEWVSDWQGSYPSDPQQNPTGPDSGSIKVLRGGGWVGGENSARTARRGGNSPDSRGIPDGFRCVSPAHD